MYFDTAICGAVILSGANGFVPFIGSVGINDGRISRVSEEKILPSECGVYVDGSDRILMPGLFDMHQHGDMVCARGFGDDMTLREQNERFADTNWFKSLITDDERADSRLLSYAESLLAGTTFRMENMYWGLGTRSPELMRQAGIRGAAAEDIRVDYMEPDVFVPQDYLAGFVRACGDCGIIPYIGSVSEEDFSAERLRAIRAHAGGLRQTFHLAETTWRRELTEERFGTTPVAWLCDNGFLGDDVLGSHVVQVNSGEVSMLAETGTSVVNTPLCEMKIADGIAPITEMVRAGVNVCLGTDGAMWNNSCDIFREMKGMALLQTVSCGIRSIRAKDILGMATVNGAKAAGAEDETGTVDEGKSADLILIRTDVPHMRPLCLGDGETVTSSVVFSATGADVTDVFVRGRNVVKNGALMTMNVREVWERVQKTAEKIGIHESRK